MEDGITTLGMTLDLVSNLILYFIFRYMKKGYVKDFIYVRLIIINVSINVK